MKARTLVLTLAAVASAAAVITVIPGFSTGPGRATAGAASGCASPYDAGSFDTAARPGVIPDVVCMDLQLAQDKLQAAGYTNLRSADGTGGERSQTYDRNWYVTEQSERPGDRPPTGTVVTLTAVKYGDDNAAKPYDRSQPGPVPRLTCFDLQEAQDTLQSVGFYSSKTVDDEGRHYVYSDRDWTVEGQYPTGGKVADKNTRIVLHVEEDEDAGHCH